MAMSSQSGLRNIRVVPLHRAGKESLIWAFSVHRKQMGSVTTRWSRAGNLSTDLNPRLLSLAFLHYLDGSPRATPGPSSSPANDRI